MHKIIMLSGVTMLAAISFTNLARAESGPWYNNFQIEACKRMPSQAGCFGYEGMSAPSQATPTAVPAKKRIYK